MRKIQKYKAFTIAEVLITLGIIGVVAALTIPSLMKNYQDAQYKAAYKRGYSALNQAFIMAKTNDLLIDGTTGTRPNGFDKNFMAIMNQMKISKTCASGSDNSDCWADGEKFGLSYSTGYPQSASYAYMDASGMAWSEYYSGSSSIFLDINGPKKPNQWGKDRFIFNLLDTNNAGEGAMGIPEKISIPDDNIGNACYSNKCGTTGDPDYGTYYSKSWLLNLH